jgi:signal peptidase I
MMPNKKVLYSISLATLVALLVSFFFGNGGRIAAAVLMSIVCVVTILLIKKRSAPNYVYPEVEMLMGVIAAVYAMLYCLTGLAFGFAKYNFGSTADVVLKYILPIAVIIIASEFVRNILLAQEDRFIGFLSYLSAVAAEVIIHYTLADIFTFKRFMDIMAMVFLPAILSNLLYHYLSKRYGFLPNIAYRLILTLHPYIVLYKTGIPDSLLAFINLLLPLAVYLFIDYLYEKKRKYALAQHSPLGVALTTILIVMMTGLIMLVSNVFQFGAYVIATESMTGELNKGDIAVYERYDDGEIVEVGDVIVFKEQNKHVVHRVVDKSNINGETRYYTKGDANSEADLGYITDGDIKGVVVLKLPYFGYPTLWLRDLFK